VVRPLDASWAELHDSALHWIGGLTALVVAVLVAPVAIRKLKGAGMTGQDRHKPGRPEVAEMGGVVVFAGFMAGVFTMLMLVELTDRQDALVLSALVLGCGAAMTGILDDFIALQQRFKALLPLAFAVPLALFVDETALTVAHVGAFDLGVAYTLVLVPLAIACASNSFNMLEGFNGLGAGMGVVMAGGISVAAWLGGNLTALLVTVPLGGALLGFLVFNSYPARLFPGDTMTLFAGAMLATAGILSKVEVATGIMFLPFVAEFFIKAGNGFPSAGWGGDLGPDGRLRAPPRRPVGLAQWVLRIGGPMHERTLVFVFMAGELVLAGLSWLVVVPLGNV
jgi:UDP-N-acetylglucosamine--dolichyl-phosphate N-acetylglucosaminephosphotransferase